MAINGCTYGWFWKRFTDAGYTKSKPLIPVSGKHMIERLLNACLC
jgi:NDP-sugar pyrophosphorylase family protein